ncbi:MAG: hypothetical protein KF784_12890 [Fimbriimonadaceae bacterium]|nr:hypothetical protein [Fimbriimonadaceae bacterium]
MKRLVGFYYVMAAIVGYFATVVLASIISLFVAGVEYIGKLGPLIWLWLGPLGAVTGLTVAFLFRKKIVSITGPGAGGYAYLISLTNIALFCLVLAAARAISAAEALAAYGIIATVCVPILLPLSLTAWYVMRWADRNDVNSLWERLEKSHA